MLLKNDLVCRGDEIFSWTICQLLNAMKFGRSIFCFMVLFASQSCNDKEANAVAEKPVAIGPALKKAVAVESIAVTDSNTLKVEEKRDPFQIIFFRSLDSIGYDRGRVVNIDLSKIESTQLSDLFLYNFRTPYTDSVFKEEIVALNEYHMEKKAALASGKKANRFHNSLIKIKEVTLSNSNDVRKAKDKYDGILNAVISAGGGRLSKSFYDLKNNKIWFVALSSAKRSSELNEVFKVMSLAEKLAARH